MGNEEVSAGTTASDEFVSASRKEWLRSILLSCPVCPAQLSSAPKRRRNHYHVNLLWNSPLFPQLPIIHLVALRFMEVF